MTVLVQFAAIFALSIGIAVLWANPGRFTNQAFAVTALIASIHLIYIVQAIRSAAFFSQSNTTNPIIMLRVSAAVAVFFPWMLWILKESLVNGQARKLETLQRSLPWLGLSVVLAMLCLSNSYIPAESLQSDIKRGPSFILVNLTLVAVYIVLIGQSLLQMRRQHGIRQIEMQFFVLNSATGALLAVGFAFLGRSLDIPILRRLSPFAVIGACALAAWAVTYYRIFDVRQVFLSLAQRIGLVLFLGLGIYFVSQGLDRILPPTAALFLSVAICSSLALWLDRRSREWLGLGGERALSEMRRAVIEGAPTEPYPEKLGAKFQAFLCEQCRTPSATLLFYQGELYSGGDLELAKDRLGWAALVENDWATPESLQRRRFSPARDDLLKFLQEHSLGLMVAAPRGSPAPALLIALSTKFNEWPFTYPEVQRLQNIAELMDNILTRSRLTLQAAIRAKMEHLAMMSRGLAHDLNNLITPISSFLVHTDDRFPPGSSELEVHAAAKRSVRIMADYVREALFFSERLTPRFEQVKLAVIFREVFALFAAPAMARAVILTGAPDYDGPLTADAVLLQRMLTNVIGNAIDASNRGQTVSLSARAGRNGWLCVQVVDQGGGIAPENLARIFDPYFTTKKYGDEIRGFGLGLTICQKIVQLHGGTIAINSQLGQGATVTFDLPVVQSA